MSTPQPNSRVVEVTEIRTTLGALREMQSLNNKYLAIPPLLSDFLLDNGYRRDDTDVVLTPGEYRIDGDPESTESYEASEALQKARAK